MKKKPNSVETLETFVEELKNKPNIVLPAFGMACAFLGYWLAYFFFHEMLFEMWRAGNSEADQWLRGILDDLYFQTCCGFPAAMLIGTFAAIFLKNSDWISQLSTKARFFIIGLCLSIGGFIFYFPYQFFLVLAAAF